MARATSSQGWSRKAPPRTMSMAMPVAATPAPMMTVPCASSQTSRRIESAGAASHDGLAVPPARAHREGQQEGGQEQRDREHDVRREQDGEEVRGKVTRPAAQPRGPPNRSPGPDRRCAGRPPRRLVGPRAHGRRRCPTPGAGRRCPLSRRRDGAPRASSEARSTRRPATRLARTRSKGRRRSGRLPCAPSIAMPLRRAFSMVASTAMGSVSMARMGAAPSSPAVTARMPEPEPTSRTEAPSTSALVRPALEAREAEPRRGVEAGAEGHARVERDDDVIPRGLVLPPGRPDDDAAADAQDGEVLLPRLRPVLLVDVATCEIADGTQARTPCRWPRRSRVAATACLGSALVARREVGPDDGGRTGRWRPRPGPPARSLKGCSTETPPAATRERISLTASTASGSASTRSSSQVPAADVPSSTSGSRRLPTRAARYRSTRSTSRPAQLMASLIGRRGCACSASCGPCRSAAAGPPRPSSPASAA